MIIHNALNGIPIHIEGAITTSIKLELLPDLTNVTFLVLKNNTLNAQLIFGRDFLTDHKISITIKPSDEDLNNRIQLFSKIAFAEAIDPSSNKNDKLLLDINTDFNISVEKQLISVIKETENANVPLIKDDHSIKVNLKDESIFAYSPRRFAYSEKIQIRKITEDLLARNIIKESNSPHCARIVPVKKKDGSMRLCIDLRPLNSRTNKQKYPFPIIKDNLARLSDKSIFTLLDLKDGFHHIPIHPDHTKYFSFATPDGQYEYLHLPFGFCEAPAEFQKHLVILQPLIREDKVIV